MRLIKVIGAVVVGLVLLAIVAVVLLLTLFDPNRYKPDIERLVERQTQRTLMLQGDLKLSVFPWLAVQMGPAQLSERSAPAGGTDDFGKQPFVAFQSARLSVKLWPLLHGKVEIGEVQLLAPSIRLITAADGRHNWDDLAAANSEPAAPEPASSGAVQATIGTVDIRQGEVLIDDRRGKTRTALHEFSLRANGIGSGQPFDVQASFELEKDTATAQATFDTAVDADTEHQRYTLSDLHTAVTWHDAGLPKAGLPIELRAAHADVDLAQQSLVIDGLQLNVGAAALTGRVLGKEIVDAPQLSGHVALASLPLRDVFKQLNIQPPAMRGPALQQVQFESDFTATKSSAQLTKLSLRLDDTTARGELGIADFDAKALRFDLNVDRIDFDRYLPPPTEAKSAAEKPQAAAPTPIPVDFLRTLNMRGSLKIGAATFSGLKLSDVRVGAIARNGDIHIAPTQANLYGGSYAGDIALNVADKSPKLALNTTVTNVDFAPLLLDMLQSKRIAGHGNFNAKLTARGADTDAMLKTLGGTLAFNVKDGAYEGMDLWYEIRRARALLRQQPIPARTGAERTPFTSFQGTGVVTDGVLANKDLLVAMQYLKVDGQGSVDFVHGTMDYRLSAKVLRIPPESAGDNAASMNDLVDADIPIKVTGPLASPSVRPDVEGLVKAKVNQAVEEQKQKLQQTLQDKLKDLLGK